MIPLTLETIEYVDFKRNTSHKFIKDSSSIGEIYIEENGTETKVENVRADPIFNEIAAGMPILINDSLQRKYYLPKQWVGNSNDVFILKIKGDSTMTIEKMIEELEMYYEAAGFADINERDLKHKTEDEIRELYNITFVEKNEE